MSSAEHVRQCFARATTDADLAVIEGVMGLIDGASPAGLEGSTAEIAMLLESPVVLVAGAHGAARSLAATVKGFGSEPGLRVAGVIANQAGSLRHRAWLAEALAGAKLPPFLGAVPRDALAPLQSRHLGLVTADRNNVDDQTLESLADACAEHVDMKALLQLANNLPSPAGVRAESLPSPRGRGAGGGCLFA